MAQAPRDENRIPTLLGTSNADGVTPVVIWADPVTHRLLIDLPGGSGTVTSVSVVTANGFAGSVANATTTPAITLTTTVSGVLKGNGTAISQATAGTDYVAPGAITTSGLTQATARILGRTTAATGAIEEISVGTGLTLSAGSLVATGVAASIVIGTTTITSGTTTRILYDNAGVIGEYTITGTGTVVAMQTNPTLSGITMTDATNIVLNTTTGTKIGTATSQKLAFFNSTPIVQPTGDVVTALQNLGLVASATVAATSIAVGTTTISGGTNTRILYDNSGVLGEYTVTGTGTTAVLSTSPTFTTSIITPLIVGGTGTTGTQLTIQTTSGNGTTDQMLFKGGNNGATTFATLKANSLDLGTSAVLGTGTIELGAATDTTLSRSAAGVLAVEGVVIPSISSTNTLTNKRMTRRLTTTNAPGATPTTNTDNVDIMNFTGLGAAITSMTTNLSGTPVDGDLLEFRFTDDGTARGITWGTSFASTTVTLPTTTVISTMLRVGFEWSSTASKWQCVAVA